MKSLLNTGSKVVPGGMVNPGVNKEDFPIPENMVGLVIGNKFIIIIIIIIIPGRGGETIKNIHNKTGAYVFIPKECERGATERVLTISGKPA